MPKVEEKFKLLNMIFHLSKGQEMGSFSLGSTVILLSQENVELGV